MRPDSGTAPIIFAVVLQSLTAIWWASTITADIRQLKAFAERADTSIRGIDETRFPADEESKYREEIASRLFAIEESVRELQTRLRRQQ